MTAGFPDVHLHFPDSNGKVFELELTPEARLFPPVRAVPLAVVWLLTDCCSFCAPDRSIFNG